MSIAPSQDSIYISSITLEVRLELGRPVSLVVFETSTGGFKREIRTELLQGDKYNTTFNPALKLSVGDRLSVSIRHRSGGWGLGHATLHIPVEQSEITKRALDVGDDTKSYVTVRGGMAVTVNFSHQDLAAGAAPSALLLSTIGGSVGNAASPSTVSQTSKAVVLPTTGEHPPHATSIPTTDAILELCARFRLLVIGNSGVGKTALIQRVFGVKDMDVSDTSRGQADIDAEYIAAENDKFVLHDSLGLEAGEGDNLEKIKGFIEDRRKREHLKDRLHAIWVCIQVPYAGQRVLETGTEEFLRKRHEIVGNIPVIIVLTKLELLDNLVIMQLRGEGVLFKSLEEARPHLEPRKATFFEEYCAKPLLQVVGNDIPYVAVSTFSGYGLEPTISDLVKTTISEIQRYSSIDPSHAVSLHLAQIAQRVSLEAKVDLSVATGKRRYWSTLGTSFRFSASKVNGCLLCLHQEIIRVWNFHDPENALGDKSFTDALLDTSELGVDDIPDALAALSYLRLVVSNDPITRLNDPTMVVITLSLTAAVAIAEFCGLWYQIYKLAKIIAKSLMAHTFKLVFILTILFILAPQGSITSHDVNLALQVYQNWGDKNRVQEALKNFSTSDAMLPGRRKKVVDEVEKLIKEYSLTDEEVSRLRGHIQAQAVTT